MLVYVLLFEQIQWLLGMLRCGYTTAWALCILQLWVTVDGDLLLLVRAVVVPARDGAVATCTGCHGKVGTACVDDDVVLKR